MVSSGQLAPLYGFTDTDGTQPDCWRYVVEVQDKGLPANDHACRKAAAASVREETPSLA